MQGIALQDGCKGSWRPTQQSAIASASPLAAAPPLQSDITVSRHLTPGMLPLKQLEFHKTVFLGGPGINVTTPSK